MPQEGRGGKMLATDEFQSAPYLAACLAPAPSRRLTSELQPIAAPSGKRGSRSALGSVFITGIGGMNTPRSDGKIDEIEPPDDQASTPE